MPDSNSKISGRVFNVHKNCVLGACHFFTGPSYAWAMAIIFLVLWFTLIFSKLEAHSFVKVVLAQVNKDHWIKRLKTHLYIKYLQITERIWIIYSSAHWFILHVSTFFQILVHILVLHLGGRGMVALCLVVSTLIQVVQVWALSGDMVLSSWARHFTLRVPLSTP